MNKKQYISPVSTEMNVNIMGAQICVTSTVVDTTPGDSMSGDAPGRLFSPGGLTKP